MPFDVYRPLKYRDPVDSPTVDQRDLHTRSQDGPPRAVTVTLMGSKKQIAKALQAVAETRTQMEVSGLVW